jgi:hypothetical protein
LYEKRVYLPKPALNLLKTWFSREKPAEMSSKQGFARPGLSTNPTKNLHQLNSIRLLQHPAESEKIGI